MDQRSGHGAKFFLCQSRLFRFFQCSASSRQRKSTSHSYNTFPNNVCQKREIPTVDENASKNLFSTLRLFSVSWRNNFRAAPEPTVVPLVSLFAILATVFVYLFGLLLGTTQHELADFGRPCSIVGTRWSSRRVVRCVRVHQGTHVPRLSGLFAFSVNRKLIMKFLESTLPTRVASTRYGFILHVNARLLDRASRDGPSRRPVRK